MYSGQNGVKYGHGQKCIGFASVLLWFCIFSDCDKYDIIILRQRQTFVCLFSVDKRGASFADGRKANASRDRSHRKRVGERSARHANPDEGQSKDRQGSARRSKDRGEGAIPNRILKTYR